MLKLEHVIFKTTLTRRLFIFLIILIMGCLDYATGNEFSFSIFYLAPVCAAAWYDTKRCTYITIFVTIFIWIFVDYSSGRTYTNLIAPIWNAAVRFTFFIIVAVLILKIRGNLVDLTKMAMKDTLTELDNSRAFQLQYRALQQRSLKNNKPYAMGVLDLDGFKRVNDTLGHSKGDDVLVEFAKILKSVTRGTDVLARMGGDEFVVILKDMDFKGAQEYEKRLRRIFNDSDLKARTGVDYSMGISIFNQLPKNLDEATHKADVLMYRAKELGKAQTTIRIA